MKLLRPLGGLAWFGAAILSTGCVAYPDGTVAVLPPPPPVVVAAPPVVVAPVVVAPVVVAPVVTRRVYAYRSPRSYRPYYYYGRKPGWYGRYYRGW